MILAAALFMSQWATAQFAEHALGLRVSGDDDVDGIGAEISYQHALGSGNRGELDLGFHTGAVDVVKLTGIYQWVWNIQDGLNWYIGPGAGLGIIDRNNHHHKHHSHDHEDDTNLLLSLNGDIGIEYIFDEVPIQLALDLRPEFFVINDYGDGFDLDLGFAIRWQFQ